MILTKIFQIGVATLFFGSSLAIASTDPLVGNWKTIDNKTGYSLADVAIQKNKDGTYSAKVIDLRAKPGAALIPTCVKCKGKQKDQPIVGMTVLNSLKADPKNKLVFNNGVFLEPSTGLIYNTTVHLSNNGKHLILQNAIKGSTNRQNITWMRY